MQLQPYLFFEGRCEEAAQFYEGRSAQKSAGSSASRIVPIRASAAPRTPTRSCT